MTKLDELISLLKLLFPKGNFNTDASHTGKESHWLTVRFGHALVVIIWRPGTPGIFRINTEVDPMLDGTDEVEMPDDDIFGVLDYFLHHITERGLA